MLPPAAGESKLMLCTRLALLLPIASASWWDASPPLPFTGTVCPGGAEFKYAQVWPSGFRAVVTMGKWVTGRALLHQH